MLTFTKGELYRSLHIYVIYNLDRKIIIVHIKGSISLSTQVGTIILNSENALLMVV